MVDIAKAALEAFLKQFTEAARGNVEQHLGDVAGDYEDGEPDADAIYDEVYTLAFDGAKGAGCPMEYAGVIATEIAMQFSAP